MNPIAIDLGPISISWYALFIVTGMILGTLLARKEAKKHNISEELLMDYVFYAILIGIAGARAWYVLFDAGYYLANPNQIFAIWNGGLAIHGGLLAGFIYTLYFTKKNNISIYKLGDLAAPSLLLAQAIGRYGNFMNSEAHGPATTESFLRQTLHLPDFIVNGMCIDGVYYQPTFLYESTWNILGFVIIMLVLRKKWRFDYGKLTAFYLMWYGFIRFFIEFLRTDALTFGPVRVAQLMSLIMFIAGTFLMYKKINREKNE